MSTQTMAATPPPATEPPTGLRKQMIINLAVNLVAPAAMFYGLRALGVNQWWALLLGVLPPGIRAGYTLVKRRKIDTLAVFTLSILVLSVGMSFVSGSPRFLLAKDGWMTAAAGAWMLVTLARTPFIFQVVRTFLTGPAAERAELKWRDSPTYRRVLRAITTMWGVALVLDAGVRVVLAYTLPVDQVLLISGLQYAALYVTLEVLTRIFARRKGIAAAVEAESGQRYL
ncbi:VC0807 family protein [Labedaea rhizosphaerae]|uniref:Intracellular septation protein A n=1 Tax=Labedaea rhizosphaerae TaxID=598644 RepID=A0A4R6SDB6_LABRH|nr:VC0807 family protein [Labedaea rhizosphaerae]TDP98109.1 hypothetical protein EV186_1031089 [Labedaea rhizosphaerae]